MNTESFEVETRPAAVRKDRLSPRMPLDGSEIFVRGVTIAFGMLVGAVIAIYFGFSWGWIQFFC